MKVGAENSKKTALAVGLFIVALFLVIRLFSSGESANPAASANAPTGVPAAPGAHRTTPHRNPRTAQKQTSGPVTPNLDPRLHLSELENTEKTDYTGKGRNIFLAQATDVVIPKPVAPAIVNNTPPPTPQVYTPPPPPPIEIKFFGFASSQGVKKVFLSKDGDVFVASEGDIVNRRYKIVKINANNIEVLDVLNNNRQTIPLSAS